MVTLYVSFWEDIAKPKRSEVVGLSYPVLPLFLLRRNEGWALPFCLSRNFLHPGEHF
jgi:hypothetical protein